MNNIELHNILTSNHHTQNVYASVLPIDLMPNKAPPMYLRPYAMIINLSPITNRNNKTNSISIEHWVVLYLDKKPKYSEYFDSFALKPPRIIKDFLNDENYLTSTKQLQGQLTSTCGVYCVFYIYMKSLGYSMQFILDKFSNDYLMNDIAVTAWLNKKFYLNKNIYDAELIKKHLSSLSQMILL